MIRVPFISCAIVLAVAACGKSEPVDKQAGAATGLPDVNARAPSASGEPHVQTQPAAAPAAGTVRIPAIFHGRWGLTPADCTPGRSDAKGLLEITPDIMRFYESRAVPAADMDIDANSISGHFTFTGEGQSWSKYEALKFNKDMLVRTEANPTASFTYAKCN